MLLIHIPTGLTFARVSAKSDMVAAIAHLVNTECDLATSDMEEAGRRLLEWSDHLETPQAKVNYLIAELKNRELAEASRGEG